ncbi:MAG TPA: DnaA regulatory inactivator Hda [Rhodanobacteraceae bacterium]|nr:DnaA regulatory inactivator Hda [Rhodanobacteraceae bacterium]
MIRQYPLDLRWPPHQRLDAFWPGPNANALRAVADIATGHGASAYLHGAHGTGKTHLLIAACRRAGEARLAARYVTLAELGSARGELIAGLRAEGLLALDDVQAVAGDASAERALFDLYNRAHAAHACLLLAATAAPTELGMHLPDLVSRLSTPTRYALHPMDDADRRTMLRMLAERLGLRLDDDVLDWWFARQPRDAASMVALLQRLDRASLAAQRRITIPFLRELLRDAVV